MAMSMAMVKVVKITLHSMTIVVFHIYGMFLNRKSVIIYILIVASGYGVLSWSYEKSISRDPCMEGYFNDKIYWG